MADQLADLSTVRVHILHLPGQEWQYEISTVSAHISRSTGRYISPFLLLELIVADQVADLPSPLLEASSAQK